MNHSAVMRPRSNFRVLTMVIIAVAAPSLDAVEVIHDFRTETFDTKQFRLEGPNASQFIHPESQGLHWRFGEGKTPERPVGVYWNTRIQGDFAVTVSYAIQVASTPKKGGGVGAELYLMLDGPSKDGIALSRVELPDGSAAIKFMHLANDSTSGQRTMSSSRTVMTQQISKRGRLRFVRTGAELVAAWSEGDDTEFSELQRTEVPGTDLNMARFAGVTGSDTGAKLDMRLLEYRLGRPDSPSMQVATKPAPAMATSVPEQSPVSPDSGQSAVLTVFPTRSEQSPPGHFPGAFLVVGLVCLGGSLLLWLFTKWKAAR